jgi:hypothetical protein
MRELAIAWSLRGWIEAFENGHLVVARDKQEWWEQRCIEQRELLGLPAIASQPLPELEGLREALAKHRYDYAEIDLVAQCSCGWKYDAPVGRYNGWDWWAIHFEAVLAPDFAETEEAIRKLSWDESYNGKWTAVVRVEHVLAILRAALTRGAVGG